ncbi:hypothetical protein [Streptomyces sp. NPDC003952]
MAFTATYDALLGRIRLAASGLGATAARCTIDRTTDGIRYTVVRGGSSRIVAGSAANLDDYEFPPGVATTYRLRSYTGAGALVDTLTVAITQDVDGAWLKVPAAPYLNLRVDVSVRMEVGRRSRAGVFDVVGRSFPVAVGDVRSSREFTLQVRTQTAAEQAALDYALALGDVVYLQVPAAQEQFPSGYFTVGNASHAPERRYTARRIWSLDLVEVAAPGPDVVGSTYTNQSVLLDYATVSAVIADNATIADLLDRTASPSEVIVP